MKEKLYTIPLTDAFRANDECPFCYVERSLEQDALDFTLGACSSYMESDVREKTDRMGFCRHHLKMMHDYGNALGNGLILKTHVKRVNRDMQKQLDALKKGEVKSAGLFAKKDGGARTGMEQFLADEMQQCFVCNYYADTYERYIDTFFYLYDNDRDFIETLKNSKGFCLYHVKHLIEGAQSRLSAAKQKEFYGILAKLIRENMKRIEEDISWFVDKFDYRYKDADWKNSKDAIPRTMQKLAGGYPADDPYKMP